MEATQLAFYAMETDLELKKKLTELLDMLHKLDELKKQESNPVKRDNIDKNIVAVKEIIGKIRYHSLDELGVMSKKEQE
jgi:hypothetical protein